MPQEVVVVGGGVIGRTSALRLLSRGHSVTVLDSCDPTLPASLGNAGHLAIEQTAPLASWSTLRSLPRLVMSANAAISLPLNEIRTWLPWGVRLIRASGRARFTAGRELLRTLLQEAIPAWRSLLTLANAPDLLVAAGHLVLAESKATQQALIAGLRAEPPGPARWAILDAARMQSLAARFRAPLVGGVEYSNTGQITDLSRMMQALTEAILAQGGRILEDQAIAVLPEATGVRVTTRGRPALHAQLALIAAGVRSGDLLRPLGVATPLIAERGYHLEADAPPGPSAPPVVFADRSVVFTRFERAVRVTSFTEFTRADAAANPKLWLQLERHVSELGLPFSGGMRRWLGSRPTLPDYLPAIGRLARWPQIAYAFGHQHLGLTLAARTAEIVAEMLEQTPAPPLAGFHIERFA